jgi:glycosyltransferase involved in cell wall biosynthesis
MTRSDRTRIVFVNHTGLVSGAERVLVSMLRAIDRTRNDPFVLCPAEGGLAEMVRNECVPCFSIPLITARFTRRFDRLIRDFMSLTRVIVAMRQRISELNPDVIHANSIRAGVVATLATMGTRRLVIWHVHDTLPQHPLSAAIRLLAYLTPRTRIVAVSNSTAKAFCGNLPFNRRARTLHNGIELNRFPLKRPGDSEFRSAAGIPDSAFLICAVGQICARKGLRELIVAFRRIHAVAPEIHLAIVGRAVFPHEEQYLESLVAAVDAAGLEHCVHFTGEIGDVSVVMRSADLLVLNSHEEPFGLVLIEAMSSGTPVLAARVGGVPEIITDGESGWLVEKGDTDGLGRKLLELSQNRKMLADIADIAVRTTCPRFSFERFQDDLRRFHAEMECGPDLQWKTRCRPALARNVED